MKLYLTPEPSLELIRYLRSTNGEDGIGGSTMRKRTLSDALNTTRALDELDTTAQLWLSHIDGPVHAFVGDHAKGTSTKRLITHVLSGSIPHGCFINLGHGVCICSPNFVFLQMASKLSLLEAAQLGMELCGSYSHWRLVPRQMGDPYYFERPETRACTFEIPPAASVVRLLPFLERMRGQRGVRNALAAIRWMADDSASPMETAVFLLLSLPKRLGGYGLPKPVLNPKLIISNPDGSKERYPDMFWAGANIDVEYNSDAAHSGEWARYRDSKREIEMTVANLKVLPLTRPQLMRVEEFDAFARGLRRMLGIRARGADLGWQFRRDELHETLLKDWK